MAKKYDVLIIGSGPAGYVAAIKLSQLGKKVACIDANEHLGGTCLNVGCIPSKSLLQSSHHYYKAKNDFHHQGIYCEKLTFSLPKMMEEKKKTLEGLGQGIAGLFKKNKVDYFNGLASFQDAHSVTINMKNGPQQKVGADNIIIATGSNPIHIPDIAVDEKYIITSTGGLSLSEVPKKMAIIGAGAIGIEIGSVWSRLGSDVTVIEFNENILSGFDQDMSREARRSLQKQGLKFLTSSKVNGAHVVNNQVILEVTSKDGTQKMTVDKLLVAVGRKAHTDNLGLENIGITTDSRGKIEVNNQYQTVLKNVYAVGDVIAGPMLAHKAADEGIAVAEILAGEAGHVNYDVIPNVVYTHPEIASVGKSEYQLKEGGVSYNTGKFPIMANSRGRAIKESEGFVKILACSKTDTILGVHIIAANAGELIAEAVVAMEFKASSEDLARICKPHPTLNEAVKEAALATYSQSIHF
jgi:dihydrolipoamide dehydrogenase